MNNIVKEEIMVSICCLVYNHEKYLRRCLDGFIMQKTNFKYEVLIHDDASTDDSAKIIKEYAEKYPDIIKPIFQKENQYSKGIKVSMQYQYPRAKGKYIAFCEGDDYWIDENKLQIQYDIMNKYNNVSICVHNVLKINEKGKKIRGEKFPPVSYNQGIIEKQQFMEAGLIKGKWLFQTSSYFYRTSNIIELLNEKPDFIEVSMIGDLPLFLFMLTRGDIYYIDRDMSNYRVNSCSSVMAEYTKNKRKQFFKAQLLSFEKYNKYTNEKYSKYIEHQLLFFKASLMVVDEKYTDVIKNAKYRKALPIKTQIKCILLSFMPHIGNFLIKTYNWINQVIK